MATRNLTKKFNEIRNGAKALKKLDQFNFLGEPSGGDDFNAPSYSSDDELLRRDEEGVRDSGLNQQLPPRWVEVIDTVEVNILKMTEQIKALNLLHSARLKVTFEANHEAHTERRIEDKTREVTSLFRTTEQSVKKLGLDDLSAAEELSQAELAVRFSVVATATATATVAVNAVKHDIVIVIVIVILMTYSLSACLSVCRSATISSGPSPSGYRC